MNEIEQNIKTEIINNGYTIVSLEINEYYYGKEIFNVYTIELEEKN